MWAGLFLDASIEVPDMPGALCHRSHMDTDVPRRETLATSVDIFAAGSG